AVPGRPAAPAGDPDVPGPRQITDHLALHDPRRLGAGSEPAPIAYGNGARDEPRLAHRVEDVADGLGRRTEVGIIGVTQRLRDERDDGTLHAGTRESVLQRLLNHVDHPSGR